MLDLNWSEHVASAQMSVSGDTLKPIMMWGGLGYESDWTFNHIHVATLQHHGSEFCKDRHHSTSSSSNAFTRSRLYFYQEACVALKYVCCWRTEGQTGQKSLDTHWMLWRACGNDVCDGGHLFTAPVSLSTQLYSAAVTKARLQPVCVWDTLSCNT